MNLGYIVKNTDQHQIFPPKLASVKVKLVANDVQLLIPQTVTDFGLDFLTDVKLWITMTEKKNLHLCPTSSDRRR